MAEILTVLTEANCLKREESRVTVNCDGAWKGQTNWRCDLELC